MRRDNLCRARPEPRYEPWRQVEEGAFRRLCRAVLQRQETNAARARAARKATPGNRGVRPQGMNIRVMFGPLSDGWPFVGSERCLKKRGSVSTHAPPQAPLRAHEGALSTRPQRGRASSESFVTKLAVSRWTAAEATRNEFEVELVRQSAEGIFLRTRKASPRPSPPS